MHVKCFPFQVQVGANLIFPVGTLTYTDSTQAAQQMNVIIGATLGGVAVVTLLIIAVMVIVALRLMYWNKRTKRHKYNM